MAHFTDFLSLYAWRGSFIIVITKWEVSNFIGKKCLLLVTRLDFEMRILFHYL